MLGVAFVPLTGVHYDEALFVMAIFAPASAEAWHTVQPAVTVHRNFLPLVASGG